MHMKFSIRGIISYIFNWEEDVQDRVFMLLTMIALSGMILAAIGSLIVGEAPVSIISTVAAFVVFSILVYTGYRFGKIRMMANILAFILVMVFFPFIFLQAGA